MTSTIPETMRAAVIDRFGGDLDIRQIPVPEISPNEVLIRVEAAGVGVWDPWERDGAFADLFRKRYGVAPTFPYVIGFDGAGTVAAVGASVRGFRVGDQVYADRYINPKGGFYAEYAAVIADHISPIPGNLSVEAAGAMPVDAITALIGLDDTLKLKSSETLVVFGAGGGLGHLALQIAKRMGARVLAVCSGQDGVAMARRLGADAVVEGRTEDLLAAATDFAPEGIDAALLTAGGNTAENALKALREDGRVAWPLGVQPVAERRPGIAYSEFMGDEAIPETFEKLNCLIDAGPFEVHVARVFPLEQAGEAHRALGEHYLGKLALRF